MMNPKQYKTALSLVVSLFVSAALLAQPAGIYKLKLFNGSRIWVEGDSTMHEYRSTSTAFEMDTEIVFKSAPVITDSPIQALVTNTTYAPRLQRMVINLPVRNFHSKAIGFDGQFHSTLKYKENPNISFTLSDYTYKADTNFNNRFFIRATGIVRIAGKEKPITINTVAVVNDSSVTLTGQTDLLMTDFNITPPKLLFVTTYDKVTIKWELLVTIAPREPVL